MQQHRSGSNLIQLTRFPQWFPVNVYLVEEVDSLTLIDTGIGGCERAILAAAQQLGKPITRIVLTHMHMDHIGSLVALHAALPNADILYSERAARTQAGALQLAPDEPVIKDRAGYPRQIITATRVVQDGDMLGSLQVISCPGHSPGDIALFDTRDHSLIAGDAFQTRGAVAVAGTIVWSFPFLAIFTWDRAMALRSAQTLRRLNPSRLAVGHGQVLEEPTAAMDVAIARATQVQGKAHRHGA